MSDIIDTIETAAQTGEPCGEAITELREQLGVTQTELGERLGVTQQHISRLESGERAPGMKVMRGLWGMDEQDRGGE